MAPNSYRIFSCFFILCHFLSIRPRLSLFRALFTLKSHPKIPGWWFVGPRHQKAFIHGLPSAIHGWKERFFFVSSDRPWGRNWSWGTPDASSRKNSDPVSEDEEDHRKLRTMKLPSCQEILTEQNLLEVGFSPRLPRGKDLVGASFVRIIVALIRTNFIVFFVQQ